MDEQDNQDDLEIIMQQTLEANNGRIIDIMFNANICDEDRKKIESYCHYDYNKKKMECIVCLEAKLAHKCFQCQYWLCTSCFVSINSNPQSSKCPSCRFEYSIPVLVKKTVMNIDSIKKKFGEDALSNKIMPFSVFEEKQTPEDMSKIFKFNSQYNYRDNRLEVNAECNNELHKFDLLKINVNIEKYPVPTQVNLIERMHDAWCTTISNGNSKAWNTAANKVSNKLRLKLSHVELDEFLDEI
jgi:hypothetical protein